MSQNIDPLDAGLAVVITISLGFVALLIALTVYFGGIGGLASLGPGIMTVALLLGGLVFIVIWLRNQF